MGHFRQPSRRGRTDPSFSSLLPPVLVVRQLGIPTSPAILDSCPRPTHSFVGHRAERKKGSTLKISQWIVKLLRDPETNPSVIMWEDEPEGKFRVINSNAFAQLWAVEKKNPAMNYEKLSRAMRYYYRNKEIEMVKGERLTYKFGPNMRDFRAKD